jgi:hypothetical protein
MDDLARNATDHAGRQILRFAVEQHVPGKDTSHD